MSEHKRRGRPPKVYPRPLDQPYVIGEGRVLAEPDTTNQLKTLLKAIYNSGQLGIKRSLDKDMATLQAILEGKTDL